MGASKLFLVVAATCLAPSCGQLLLTFGPARRPTLDIRARRPPSPEAMMMNLLAGHAGMHAEEEQQHSLLPGHVAILQPPAAVEQVFHPIEQVFQQLSAEMEDANAVQHEADPLENLASQFMSSAIRHIASDTLLRRGRAHAASFSSVHSVSQVGGEERVERTECQDGNCITSVQTSVQGGGNINNPSVMAQVAMPEHAPEFQHISPSSFAKLLLHGAPQVAAKLPMPQMIQGSDDAADGAEVPRGVAQFVDALSSAPRQYAHVEQFDNVHKDQATSMSVPSKPMPLTDSPSQPESSSVHITEV